MAKVVLVEGVDYSGKSTAVLRLKAHFESKGKEVHVFGEPGSSPVGKEIRKLLVNPNLKMDEETRLVLLTAARFELLNTILPPLLEKENAVIILDRFIPSFYAYAEERHWSFMNKLCELHEKIKIDLIYHLSITEETFLERVKSSKRFQTIDGIEAKLIKNFYSYTERYRRFFEANRIPTVEINGNDPQEDVITEIIKQSKVITNETE